jgi:hypothetical protein
LKFNYPNLEENMGNESSVAKPKTRRKAVLLVCAYLVAALFIARVLWTLSGSNKWEFVGEQNGVKVYSLKTPGSDVKKFKAVFQIRSTLGGLVKYMQDPHACDDYGCENARTIEREDDQLQYAAFQVKLPAPFHKREFVIRQQFHQDPQTKAVLVEYAAAPDKAPPDACCFRVTDMANTWRLTPRGNGLVEIEYTVNMNEGGFIPELVKNLARPKYMYALTNLQGFVNREKYQSAKFDFVKEP